jgi:hypothetical protein
MNRQQKVHCTSAKGQVFVVWKRFRILKIYRTGQLLGDLPVEIMMMLTGRDGRQKSGLLTLATSGTPQEQRSKEKKIAHGSPFTHIR